MSVFMDTSIYICVFHLIPLIFSITNALIFLSGMEVASYLLDKASKITVIGSSELPYQNTLGREVGKITMTVRDRVLHGRSCTGQFAHLEPRSFLQMLSEKDVKFYMNDNVMEIKGVNGKVKYRATHEQKISVLELAKMSINKPLVCLIVLFSFKVKEVVLKSGNVVPADVLIVGVGE